MSNQNDQFCLDDHYEVISTDFLFAADENFKDERWMKVRIASMHSGKNYNNSRFSYDSMKKAKNTFKNIPILANIKQFYDKDGNPYLDYSSHDMHLEEDAFNESEERMIYDEKIVGIVPEKNNFELVYDETNDIYYAMVDALIYRNYGNYACDILEKRGGKTSVSAEIFCEDCSYDAEDKCLDVGKFTMLGITMLGEHVSPGMKNANAQIIEFEKHIDSDNRNEELARLIKELNTTFNRYLELEKGGSGKMTDKNLEEQNEELVFTDADGNPVEEVKAKESFEAEASKEAEIIQSENFEETHNNADENLEETHKDENKTDAEETFEAEENEETATCVYSMNGKEYTYAVSLSDVIYALSTLVNETYADDKSYYYVSVYADNGYVVMQDVWSGDAYRQNYKCKKQKHYYLVGDRVPVKAVFVTEDEEKALEEIQSKNFELSEKVASYEKAEVLANKQELIQSQEYFSIMEEKEFIDLKEKIGTEADTMTFDELKKALDDILLAKIKDNNLKFASLAKEGQKEEHSYVRLPLKTKKKESRYGNLFSK